jgi:hypothetical protein
VTLTCVVIAYIFTCIYVRRQAIFWYILIPYLNRHFNIAVSETIHVQVFMFKQQLSINIFMIIQLINMNTSLSKYPVEGRVTHHPTFRYHSL